MAFQRELAVAIETAREAGAIVRRHYDEGTRVWDKGEDDPVSLADLEADRAIAKRLRDAFPDDAILSEESDSDDVRLASERVWIVDPLDGTKEFARRIPEFAVSIALVTDGQPVVGVAFNPVAEVCVWASRGDGTFRDGAPVRVSRCERLEDAVLVVSRSEIERGEIEPFAGWFAEVRPVGSIAWKLALIASGDGDFNVSVAPKNEWDVCAGDLLVREAGGVYADAAGAPRRYNQRDVGIRAGMSAGPAALVAAFNDRRRATG